MIAIGLISGNSMDGVDAALVELERGAGVKVAARILDDLCTPYPDPLRDRLQAVSEGAPVTTLELGALHVEVGESFATVACELLSRPAAAGRTIEVIGSHGQTLAHHPGRRVSVQVGDAAVIAERTGIPVVHDFRARDLAAGGEGAPLVPFVDRLLFTHPEERVGVLNIGGIANVTLLPPGDAPGQIIAFDTGPGNMVIDEVTNLVTGGRERLDRDGARATRGRIDRQLLDHLLLHPFFDRAPPRSAGRDEFGQDFARALVTEGGRRGLAPDDLVATATALTSRSIARALGSGPPPRLLVSGGGVHNPALMRDLQHTLGDAVRVESTATQGVDPDAKEALAFAVLAWAHIEGIAAGIPAVTGATRACVLGSRVPA